MNFQEVLEAIQYCKYEIVKKLWTVVAARNGKNICSIFLVKLYKIF
jgi:hypothetical protein